MRKRFGLPLFPSTDGSAMVEMAALLPFLLVLGCGVFEFGAFFYQYQMIEAGMRDAGRYLARVSDPAVAAAPCNAAVLAAKESSAKDIAVTGQIGGTAKRVGWWSQSDITISYRTVANPGFAFYRGPDPITIVRLATNPKYPGVGFLSLLGLGTQIAFSLEHEERCVGSG